MPIYSVSYLGIAYRFFFSLSQMLSHYIFLWHFPITERIFLYLKLSGACCWFMLNVVFQMVMCAYSEKETLDLCCWKWGEAIYWWLSCEVKQREVAMTISYVLHGYVSIMSVSYVPSGVLLYSYTVVTYSIRVVKLNVLSIIVIKSNISIMNSCIFSRSMQIVT